LPDRGASSNWYLTPRRTLVAYAPHTNQDTLNELRAGLIPTPSPLILGAFRNWETSALFEYSERRHPDDTFAPTACHVIYLLNGETRLAVVRKTVAHVVVDETSDGSPVWEKWHIKSHRHYPTDWVRA
jgi:hypothetical protein